MKHFISISILFFLFSNSVAYAQDTIRYDEKWQPTTSKKFSFFRVKKTMDTGGFYVKDYFKDGRLQMEGSYLSEDIKEGSFIYYYANENKESEGQYKNSNPHNKWINYFENGKVSSDGIYVNGIKDKKWQYYFDNGDFNASENYVDGKLQGEFQLFYRNAKPKRQLNYDHDTLIGNKTTYYSNGRTKRKEVYKNDVRTVAECYDSLGKKISFFEYAILPEYKYGGEEGLIKFLATNIKYVKKARKNDIDGRVVIQFSVLKDGALADVKIIKSVDPLLDNEAMRVVLLTKWKPGKIDGEYEKLSFTLPVVFELED